MLTRMLLSAVFGKFSLVAESLLFNNVSRFRRQFLQSCIHTSNLCLVLFLAQENKGKIVYIVFLHMVQKTCNLQIWSFYGNITLSICSIMSTEEFLITAFSNAFLLRNTSPSWHVIFAILTFSIQKASFHKELEGEISEKQQRYSLNNCESRILKYKYSHSHFDRQEMTHRKLQFLTIRFTNSRSELNGGLVYLGEVLENTQKIIQLIKSNNYFPF